mmetsp:Transcript_1795/g.2558  ORF Transcript_1795/g.2558 Transcript_1795/m.2558 type:complete len:648 (-) Transcript_1795:683-2626(-)
MRVVSLLPSATEVIFRLLHRQPGGVHGTVKLVGRSHECDYPAQDVANIPILTTQHTTFTTPRDVDNQVRTALQEGRSLYSVDVEKLQSLEPDVIVTQSLCSVCSIDVGAVHRIARNMTNPPQILSLNPFTLNEVLDSLIEVGSVLNLVEEAKAEREHLSQRVKRCLNFYSNDDKSSEQKNVAFIEWTDPLYVGGHWTPELIRMAGGVHGVNPKVGVKSFVISSDELVKNNPEICIVCPCGLNLDDTTEMVQSLEEEDWWWKLKAVKFGHVALVDGNQMFNRPGPRLVDCLEWITWYLHSNSTERNLGSNPLEHEEKFPWKQYEASSKQEVKSRIEARKTSMVSNSLSQGSQFTPEIEEAHRKAVEKGEKTYIDPETGYTVFTELAANERGYCCGRGCRHCTYGHWNVPDADKRKNRISQPTLLRAKRKQKSARASQAVCEITSLKVLFWSGGKDSYMTLLKLLQESGTNSSTNRIVLLTTFDPETGKIPEQDIEFRTATDQVKALGLDLDLMATPLPSSCANSVYVDVVNKALDALCKEYDVPKSSLNLVFGDLHLKDIRDWRAQMFSQYQCSFPIFDKSYSELCSLLFSSDYVDHIEISNVTVETDMLKVGMTFDERLYNTIKDQAPHIDPFGELGEFHTAVFFKQ